MFQHGLKRGGVYVIEDIETLYSGDGGEIWRKGAASCMLLEASWGIPQSGKANQAFQGVYSSIRIKIRNKGFLDLLNNIETVERFVVAVVLEKKL